MKLKNFVTMMVIALCAVSCNNDDENVSPSKKIEGTYNGTLSLSVAGADQGSSDNKVAIVATGDNTATITLGGFTAMGRVELGDIKIEGVKVTTTDNGIYNVSGTVDVNATMGDSSVKVTGTIDGTVKDGKATIEFTLKPGAMPMNITADFVGTK